MARIIRFVFFLAAFSAGSLQAQAPVITTQPQNLTVQSGQTANFNVQASSASGTGFLTFQWQRNTGTGFVNLTGKISSSLSVFLVTTSMNGYQYRVVVTDAGNGLSTTSSAALLTVQAAGSPSITGQPASQTVTVGSPATFSVSASGTAPLAYQWRKNGTAISGATGSSYQTPATTLPDSGSTFSVVVSNGVGSATSNNATLTVQPFVMPGITGQPNNVTVPAGQPAQFSVTATGSVPLGYQWRKGGVPISGATASTLAIASTAAGDAGSYDVVVSNARGTATSGAATLTVTAPIAIAVSPQTGYLSTGDAMAFTATVTGTANTTVSWTVQEGAAGGAVTSSGGYTAPAAPGVFHLLATSQADPSKSAVVTIRVTPKTCLPNA